MGAIDYLQQLKRNKAKGMDFSVLDSIEINKGKPSQKQKDTRITPRQEYEKEFIGNNTMNHPGVTKRENTQLEYGGSVRRTTNQQEIKDNSGFNVKRKKPVPKLI